MSQLNNVLSRIGEFGPFQQRVYLVLSIVTVLRCCQMFLLVYVADKPPWKCVSRNAGMVFDSEDFPCLENGSSCVDMQFSDEFTSIVSEWHLVCDEEVKRRFASAVVMTGCLLGALLFGGMADNRGRKTTITILVSISSMSCLASGFVYSFNQFVILRFITAATLNGASTAVFVLISEIVGQSVKDVALSGYQGVYAFGYVVLSVCAYFVRDWRYLTILTSFPLLLCSLFLLRQGLCESPLWLLVNGRLNECKLLIKEIARTNGKNISESTLEKLSLDVPVADGQNSSQSLSHPDNIKKIFILSGVWLLFSMLYYGLSFVSGSLSNNKYLSFSLSGIIEIPALLSTKMIQFGRKKPLIWFALFGSAACFFCALLQGVNQPYVGNVLMICSLFGKFAVAACYNIIYIFSAEHFAATVRSFSMSVLSVASSLGGILAPLVLGLEIFDTKIPIFCFALGAMLAAGLVLLLPETVNKATLYKKDE